MWIFITTAILLSWAAQLPRTGKESAESQEHRLSLGEEPSPKESFIPESASSRSGTQEERHRVSSTGAQELSPKGKRNDLFCAHCRRQVWHQWSAHTMGNSFFFKGEKKAKEKNIHLKLPL